MPGAKGWHRWTSAKAVKLSRATCSFKRLCVRIWINCWKNCNAFSWSKGLDTGAPLECCCTNHVRQALSSFLNWPSLTMQRFSTKAGQSLGWHVELDLLMLYISNGRLWYFCNRQDTSQRFPTFKCYNNIELFSKVNTALLWLLLEHDAIVHHLVMRNCTLSINSMRMGVVPSETNKL